MKIRIKDNAIRFRLTKSEVADFCEKRCYESQTEFDDSKFVYGLRMDESFEELSAEFKSNTITLKIPKKMAADWNTNSKIGFENTLSLKNGKTLHLLVEKDFTCLENRVEDESDNYPNPKMVQ